LEPIEHLCASPQVLVISCNDRGATLATIDGVEFSGWARVRHYELAVRSRGYEQFPRHPNIVAELNEPKNR